MSACGRELAKSAMVPERIAELMEHVALNLIAHARWVGTASTEADTEHAWLLRAAEDYLGIAGAARRTRETLLAMAKLGPAPHDPERWDRKAFAQWMQKKVELERSLAQLLLEHAETSSRMLESEQAGFDVSVSHS